MTDRSSALRAKTSYAAKYGVEFFERKTVASYALWSITLKDPETGRYPRLPTAYGRTDTLEQAHLELTDWCESRGLSFSDIRNDLTPWRLVKDLLEGKSGAEWHARQIKRARAANTVLDIPRTDPALVYADKGQPLTDSLVLAERFRKQHKNVLRAYDSLPNDEFNRLNFEPVDFTDQKGESRRMIRMTWKGFSMLAMGFTGEDAYFWKQQFLDAFEAMGQEIDRRRATIAEPPRKDLLAAKRAANTPMLDALIEQRAEAGKATAAHHFANEAKLCNFVVTGQFKPLDERAVTNEQAELLAIVRRRNESLLMAGLDYAERKRRLAAYATKARTARLSPPDRSGIKPPQDGMAPSEAIAGKRATEGGNPSGEGFIPAPGNTERAA
jgi:Rha family phage regulatory protein